MANCSDAYGNIVIKANSEQTIRNLVRLMTKFLNSKNACWFSELDTPADFKVYKCAEDSEYQYESDPIDFTAMGRWAYHTNCEWNIAWLKSHTIGYAEYAEADKTNSHTKPTEEDLAQMKEVLDSDFCVEYDFTDMEGGMELLYTSTARFFHKKGDENETLGSLVIDNTYDYDYNADNLLQLGFGEEAEYLKNLKEEGE